MDDIVDIAGIDVSKDRLDVHVLASNLDFVISRDKRGLTGLARRLRKAGVAEVALEASGDYERIVVEALEADGFVVHLLNPASSPSSCRLGSHCRAAWRVRADPPWHG